jgi:hypothetical protein
LRSELIEATGEAFQQVLRLEAWDGLKNIGDINDYYNVPLR